MTPTINGNGDAVCEHGTAMDVHCCNCHSGFVFNPSACDCLKAVGADGELCIYEYRPDGWPLCPVCGEDELYSQVPISISLFPEPADRMRCYVCCFDGFVPARPAP